MAAVRPHDGAGAVHAALLKCNDAMNDWFVLFVIDHVTHRRIFVQCGPVFSSTMIDSHRRKLKHTLSAPLHWSK